MAIQSERNRTTRAPTTGAIPLAAGAICVAASVVGAAATGRATELASGFEPLGLLAPLGHAAGAWAWAVLAYPAVYALATLLATPTHATPGIGALATRAGRWLARRAMGSLYLFWSLGLAGVVGLHAANRSDGSAVALGALAIALAGSGILVRNLDRRPERTTRHVATAIPAYVIAGLALTPVALWTAIGASPDPLSGITAWGYAFGALLLAIGTTLKGTANRRSHDAPTRPFIARDVVKRALT